VDLNAVLLNYGALLEAGRSKFIWNPDGTVQSKRLYADQAKTELVYIKDFFWNPDGTLYQWVLTVVTTSEVITKTFAWNPDGTLNEGGTVMT
jgi:hypothetical protein